MKPLFILLFTFIFFRCFGQITIGGQTGNTIYNHVENIITYLGDEDCSELRAEIEGFKEIFEFENCKIDLRFLPKSTSFFRIKNKAGRVIFDTLLVKNYNEGVAHLQFGNQFVKEGAIKKSELKKLEGLKIIHACPWMYERKILGFGLIVVEKDKDADFWEIEGDKISDSIRERLSKMKNPVAVYVGQIRYIGSCTEAAINSIVLEVK